MKLKISLVVITKNEAKNIANCISSVSHFIDDIIIVDSGSTDETCSIAKQLGAKVFFREWTNYADQKNFGNSHAHYDYILSLDADEQLDQQLAQAIQNIASLDEYNAYEFNFLTSFEGKFIRFGGWVPDRHIRLFNKKCIHWTHEGVHEYLSVANFPVKRLKGNVLHYTAVSAEKYQQKMLKYAMEYASEKKRIGIRSHPFKKITSTLARFLKDYVIKFGFLEGIRGFKIAIAEAKYTYFKYKWSE
jgi:glycosyltransferase involved in cell wall biosynthesis